MTEMYTDSKLHVEEEIGVQKEVDHVMVMRNVLQFPCIAKE